jgi:hypothetical protein
MLASRLSLPSILFTWIPALAANPPDRVALWSPFGAELNIERPYENPVPEVTVQVELTSPSGQKRRTEAFRDGEDHWRFRFSPDALGAWSWRTYLRDPRVPKEAP